MSNEFKDWLWENSQDPILNTDGINLNNLKKVPNYDKWISQRIECGFSDYDLVDFDSFLLSVLPAALDKIAEKDTYPDSMFNSLQSYQRYIKGIANDLREANRMTDEDASRDSMAEATGILYGAFSRLSQIFWTVWI